MNSIILFSAITAISLAVVSILVHVFIYYFRPEVRKNKKEREELSKLIATAYYCSTLLKSE